MLGMKGAHWTAILIGLATGIALSWFRKTNGV